MVDHCEERIETEMDPQPLLLAPLGSVMHSFLPQGPSICVNLSVTRLARVQPADRILQPRRPPLSSLSQ